MSELDQDRCNELLFELIRRDGGVVFRREWDSGGPGAGADAERVHAFEGLFWAEDSTLGFSGPFDSLPEALEGGIGLITSATIEIHCSSVPTAKLVKMLRVHSAPDDPFEINGESWLVSPAGRLVPEKTSASPPAKTLKRRSK